MSFSLQHMSDSDSRQPTLCFVADSDYITGDCTALETFEARFLFIYTVLDDVIGIQISCSITRRGFKLSAVRNEVFISNKSS